MSISAINRFRPLTLVCGLLVLAIAASAQVSTNQTPNSQNVSLRSVPSGSKMKFQGVVISRDAVTFRVNSAVLSPEAKSQLDEFAAKVANAKAYTIEVSGHTDSTGSEAKNFRLSRARAEAVVQYLAVNHKIPLRRFVTPMGYGKTEAVADNSTASGRAQNRRVEVKMLLNRGLNPTTSRTQP